jgi:hypothetical protein
LEKLGLNPQAEVLGKVVSTSEVHHIQRSKSLDISADFVIVVWVQQNSSRLSELQNVTTDDTDAHLDHAGSTMHFSKMKGNPLDGVVFAFVEAINEAVYWRHRRVLC